MHKREWELEEQRLDDEQVGRLAVHVACQLSVLRAGHCRQMGIDGKYLLSKKQHRVYCAAQASAQLPALPALVDLVSQLKGELRLEAISPSKETFACAIGDERQLDHREVEVERARKLATWIGQWLIPASNPFVLLSLPHSCPLESYDIPKLVELGRRKNFDIRVDLCVDGRPVDQPWTKSTKTGRERQFSRRRRREKR